MGKFLIIQGIVSKFHFTWTTVTIQTYGSEIGAQQIRRRSNNPGFIQLFGRSYPPSQAYLKGDIF